MSSNLTPGVYVISQTAQQFLLVEPGAEYEYFFYREVSAAEVAIWIADGVLEQIPYPTHPSASSSPPSLRPSRSQPPSYLRLEP